MKRIIFFILLLVYSTAFGQTSPLPFNNYIALYSEHLHTHYRNTDIYQELSLADLSLAFLKSNQLVVTKQDYIYKFGKVDSMKEPESICKTSYDKDTDTFKIAYCHNSSPIGYIYFSGSKHNWVYGYHDSEYVWIVPSGDTEGLPKYKADGKIIGTYPYSYINDKIVRIGDYAFDYDGDLISSFIDKIDTNPNGKHFSKTTYHRNRIFWEEKVPIKIVYSSGYFSNGENDTEHTEMFITIDSTDNTGFWVDLSIWEKDSTYPDGKHYLFKLHREIKSND